MWYFKSDTPDWRYPKRKAPVLRTVSAGRRWPWLLFQGVVFCGLMWFLVSAPLRPGEREPPYGGILLVSVMLTALATGVTSAILNRLLTKNRADPERTEVGSAGPQRVDDDRSGVFIEKKPC